MDKNYLISVIVPVYNVEEYLDRCIESIVNQTYKNLEIIIVDDESPDNSPQICDSWAKRDDRIRVIHKKNEGVAVARNTALEIARGDYIAFVDGDDYCFKNLYQHLLKNLVDTDSDISMCLYYESDTEIDDIPIKNLPVHVKNTNDVLPNICVGDYEFGILWNKIYKKSVVDGIRMPRLQCSQDLPYNYHAFKRSNKVVISDEQLYFYRNRITSTTKSKFKFGAFDAIKAREIILTNEKNNKYLLPYAIKGYINSNFVVLSGMIKNDMFMERFDEIRQTILLYQKNIYLSKNYSLYEKIKTLILYISPELFKKIIKK